MRASVSVLFWFGCCACAQAKGEGAPPYASVSGGLGAIGGAGLGGANSSTSQGGAPTGGGGAEASGAASMSVGNASGGDADGGSLSGGSSSDSSGSSSMGGTNAVGGAADGGNSAGGNESFGGQLTSGGSASSCLGPYADLSALPSRNAILDRLHASNDYFVGKYPDPTVDIITDRARPSNLWTRAVYYEGLMALYAIEPDPARKSSYYDYAVRWGGSPNHAWQLTYGGTSTRTADNQCCGQTYIDLYRIDPQPARIRDLKANIDLMVSSSGAGDWTWIDAIQMAMPVFAKLGVLYPNGAYLSKMHALYENTKTTQGLYNASDHLWWRDATFKPPFKTPNGKSCYWSRGNGWVFAALTRVLDTISEEAPNRDEYVTDFKAMAEALLPLQRTDGFWNVSLADPQDHGGPESTGTALFAYGMAWGVRKQLLDVRNYGPAIVKAWCALANALHANGALGYAQGTGSEPADGQPVTFDSVPDFQDYPVGCLLLAGSEAYRLAAP